MSSQEDFNKDVLFLALTRPAMYYGIPLEAAVISVIAGGLAMIFLGSIFYTVLAIPLLAISREICKKDHYAFRVIFCFLETKARCVNRSFWGGSSCSPVKLIRKYKIGDL